MTAHGSSYWNKAFSTQISLELLHVYEKATGMSRWLLGFVARRELLG
jgi:hypothetical protein